MIYKVLVLGDYGTGKSTLFERFLQLPGAEKKLEEAPKKEATAEAKEEKKEAPKEEIVEEKKPAKEEKPAEKKEEKKEAPKEEKKTETPKPAPKE